jgi:N-methylhydantoinase A
LLIPRFPGTFSAWGMLTSKPRIDLARTLVLSLTDAPSERRVQFFAEMESESERALASQGFPTDELEHQRAIDCRYHGQEHTVRVPVDRNEGDDALAARFHQLHQQLYTFRLEHTDIELVNFRLTSTIALGLVPDGHTSGPEQRAGARSSQRTVAFATGDQCDVWVYRRSELPIGFAAPGPAIIEENSSTTVVLPGQHFDIDRFGNILIAGEQRNRKEFSGIG